MNASEVANASEVVNASEVANVLEVLNALEVVNDEQNTTVFSKFCLKSVKKVIEGTMCDIIGPTRMRLLINSVNGVDITKIKDQMHTNMFNECANLPALENFGPGEIIVFIIYILLQS